MNEDNTTRTLTKEEFAAIRAFQSKWGYVGNHDISDDLAEMLTDESTDPNKLISRIMRKWDLFGPGYDMIMSDLENLRYVPQTVTRADETDRVDNFLEMLDSDNPRILHFSDDERKALESLEGEKSDMWVTPGPSAQEQAEQAERVRKADKWVETGVWDKTTEIREIPVTLAEYNKAGKSTETLRKELFREEADKRVTRYFITQTGWAWVVHFIVDMPEEFDPTMPNLSKSLYRAKDGMTTLHMTSLYMTEEKAWDRINEDIRGQFTYGDDETLTHVVELDKM